MSPDHEKPPAWRQRGAGDNADGLAIISSSQFIVDVQSTACGELVTMTRAAYERLARDAERWHTLRRLLDTTEQPGHVHDRLLRCCHPHGYAVHRRRLADTRQQHGRGGRHD